MPNEKGVITFEIGSHLKEVLITVLSALLKTEGEAPIIKESETEEAVVTTPETPDVSTQAPPPPPPTDTTVELADGIPHDIRIHASTRTKYAKPPHGWKIKRGVDPALVETVTAELRAAMDIPSPTDAAAAYALATGGCGDTPPASFVPSTVFNKTTALNTVDLAPPPAPPTPPVPPAAPITTFAELVAVLTPAIASGQLTQEIINAELAAIGLQSLPLLGARPDLIPVVAAKLFPGV